MVYKRKSESRSRRARPRTRPRAPRRPSTPRGSASISPHYDIGPGGKTFRDPVHCYIGVKKLHLSVVDLPVFQRLRRVQQMSFAELVYPGARHSRFSHSLGALHLATRLSHYLVTEGILTNDAAELLVWAALLHDIGHFPFSHAFEPAVQRFHYQVVDRGAKPNWSGAHERYGRELILGDATIVSAIGSARRAKAVCDIIEGCPRGDVIAVDLAKAVMKQRFCIDKLDYLQRDALYTGTPEYAVIDENRILSSFLFDGRHVYHRPQAQYALEGMVLSYFYLYKAVYFHHAIRAAFCLFQSILWEAFDLGIIRRDHFSSVGSWVDFDDAKCLQLILDFRKPAARELTARLRALLDRSLPKVLMDSDDFRDHESLLVDIQRLSSPDTTLFEKKCRIERAVRKKLRVREFFLDSPLFSPYSRPGDLEMPLVANDVVHPADNNCALDKKAPHLNDLLRHRPVGRIYMTKMWKDDTERRKLRQRVAELVSEACEREDLT